MTHLFKITLPHADLFINKVDMRENVIGWQVFDKEGHPLEPKKEEKFIIVVGQVLFDKNRGFPLPYIQRISEILAD